MTLVGEMQERTKALRSASVRPAPPASAAASWSSTIFLRPAWRASDGGTPISTETKSSAAESTRADEVLVQRDPLPASTKWLARVEHTASTLSRKKRSGSRGRDGSSAARE